MKYADIAAAIESIEAHVNEFNDRKKESFITALETAGLTKEAALVKEKGLPVKIFVANNIFQQCEVFNSYVPVTKHRWLEDNTIIFSWLQDEIISPPHINSLRFQ